MRSNYRKLGEYIELVNERNHDLKYGENDVRGVSNNKEIIQTKANIKNRGLSDFYIVSPNEFIYNSRTSRMGEKIGLGYNDSGKTFITSFNNTVFRIKNEKLLPAYLFMWFKRPEFDRYARYHSWGSSTELFPWNDMCNIELPVPDINKQQEAVKEYQTLVDRIRLNDRLNEKLEESAQAIFKQWFVEFEFPMTAEYAESIGKPELEGQQYKSSGGEMEYNEVLEQEIPKGWKVSRLAGIAKYLNGLAMQKYASDSDKTFLPVIKIRELNQGYTDSGSNKAIRDIPKEYVVRDGDMLFSWSGTLTVDLWCGGLGGLNQHLFKVTSAQYPKWFYYLWTKAHLTEFTRIADGKKTSMGHIKREHLEQARVLIPQIDELDYMDLLLKTVINLIVCNKSEKLRLISLADLLLKKNSVMPSIPAEDEIH